MDSKMVTRVPNEGQSVNHSAHPPVLVLGGAGYIGSHVNWCLSVRGYQTVVLDNLVSGRRESVLAGHLVEGDVADVPLLDTLFSAYRFQAVMHFAGFTSVGESVSAPSKYYRNNVINTLGLLDSMKRHGARVMIFSSTCAVYGLPSTIPIPEDHHQAPISPYGASKGMVERIIRDYASAYGFRYAILRYFNAAGADPDGRLGEWHEPETHVIPRLLQGIARVSPPLTVFGMNYGTPDGTCVRDYIHVSDLAMAHVLAMEQVLSADRSVTYNLGTGTGTSVLELVRATERVTGHSIEVVPGQPRHGDPPSLIANPDRAFRELGWRPTYTRIEDIVQTAWSWEKARLNLGVSSSCVGSFRRATRD